jgi:hypothetical protein
MDLESATRIAELAGAIDNLVGLESGGLPGEIGFCSSLQ